MYMPDLPFSLEIPISIGNLRLVFFVSDHLFAFNKSCVASPHNHGNYELRYTVSGIGDQTIEDQLFRTEAGDVLLVLPKEYHCQTPGGVGKDLARYSIRFSVKEPSEKAPASQRKSYSALISALSSIRMLHDSEFQLLSTFERIADEISNRKYGYYNHLQAACIVLFTDFIRLSGIRDPQIFPSADPKFGSYWSTQLDLFFGNRYQENIKLQDLAEYLCVSRRQASRIVMREFGISYTEKLIEVRLKKAKYQLLHTQKDMAQISADCGFQSYTYFTTCFHRSMKMTPSEYRKLGKFSKGQMEE
ncbi:MAG: AraC family transcriptional regulator [Clostridia bacterium]|nr:AraC family transcriptional regulator [Clostridia bacterium]